VGDDTLSTFLLSYYGPPGTFPTYPFASVLNPQVWTDATLKEKFRDRIVFIGATADILKDLFPMPVFQSDIQGKERAPQIPGVEIHATATAQLLDGNYIRTQSTPSTLWTLFGFTLLSSLWLAMLREWVSKTARRAQGWWAKSTLRGQPLPGRVHSLVWFALFAGLAALPPLLFWNGAKWAFIQHQLWVVAFYPLLAGLLSSGLALLMMFVAEAGERRKVTVRLERSMSREVCEEILANPEEEHLRSRRVYATVLFSDLEGFTTYSETHEPEEVVDALNEYMNRMVPIVEAHGGQVDKFIGDAIMAYFGAPIPRFDHAAQALLCAVALQEECARFRQETGIPFWMRVGLHSGDCIFGDVGSQSRGNPTVIGDTVNLASRLEGKNKEVGSWILCSASTYQEAPGVVEAEALATYVKGKADAIAVYWVHGLSGVPQQEQNWGRLSAGAATPSLPGETATYGDGGHSPRDEVRILPLPAGSNTTQEKRIVPAAEER
jgi:adenylate cyclase